MLAAKLCVRILPRFNRTSVSNSLSSYPWQLSRQLCFPTKPCRSLVCKSSHGSFDDYDQDFQMPDMSMATSEQKGATSKNSANRRHFSEVSEVLAELDQKTKEIEKLKKAINSALHHLSIVAHYLNETLATSMHEQKQKNSSEDNSLKRKADKFDDSVEGSNKKPRLESNNNLIHKTVQNYYDRT